MTLCFHTTKDLGKLLPFKNVSIKVISDCTYVTFHDKTPEVTTFVKQFEPMQMFHDIIVQFVPEKPSLGQPVHYTLDNNPWKICEFNNV